MAGYRFDNLKRLVVKLGSALLVDGSGRFARGALESIADDVAALRAAGHEILIVSSGAVAIGCNVLGINRRRARLEELQAAAAAGQAQLVQAWQAALGEHDIRAAQILLTPDDTEHRRRFLNAQGTLYKLMEHAVVPVINENDTVATDELRYGDNDRLAARVAQMVMADGLVLLSDVDGLYSADPGPGPVGRTHRTCRYDRCGRHGDGRFQRFERRQRRHAHETAGGPDRDARRLRDGGGERSRRAPAGGTDGGREVHGIPRRRHTGGGAQAVAGWHPRRAR